MRGSVGQAAGCDGDRRATMTSGITTRRVLGVACFVFGLLFAAMFLLVGVTKITVLSPVAVVALVIYGGTSATLLLAGRSLFRQR